MTKYFLVPFATSGDKTAIPDATQPSGAVSYNQGFGFDYERDNSDPDYKPVPREESNQLYFDITELLKELQDNGILPWRNDIDYAVGSFVLGGNGTAYKAIQVSGPGTTPRDPTTQAAYWTAVVVAADVYVPKINTATTANSINPAAPLDMYAVTALAQNLQINAPSGTWQNGQELVFRIKDNGVSRNLTWNAIYRPIGTTLPAATSANKTIYVFTKYNSLDAAFDAYLVALQ